MTTKEAIEHLCKELKADAGYWISWKSNIAMSFYDEYAKSSPPYATTLPTVKDIHGIANRAAENFLRILMMDALKIGPDTTDNTGAKPE